MGLFLGEREHGFGGGWGGGVECSAGQGTHGMPRLSRPRWRPDNEYQGGSGPCSEQSIHPPLPGALLHSKSILVFTRLVIPGITYFWLLSMASSCKTYCMYARLISVQLDEYKIGETSMGERLVGSLSCCHWHCLFDLVSLPHRACRQRHGRRVVVLPNSTAPVLAPGTLANFVAKRRTATRSEPSE